MSVLLPPLTFIFDKPWSFFHAKMEDLSDLSYLSFDFCCRKKTANPRPKTRGQFTGPNMLGGTGQVSGIIDVKLLLTQPSRRVYLHFLGVYFRPCLRRVDAAHSRQLGVLESHLLGFTDIEYSKNHWTLRIWGVWMILDVYSRGLGSPNHQLLRSHES